MVLAIDEPAVVNVLLAVRSNLFEPLYSHHDSELFLELTHRCEPHVFSCANMARGARVPASRVRWFVVGALLKKHLPIASYDPNEDREMPVTIAVNGASRHYDSRRLACRGEDL